jgi:cation transport ATPase
MAEPKAGSETYEGGACPSVISTLQCPAIIQSVKPSNQSKTYNAKNILKKENHMETTLQPSLQQDVRTRITVIEAIELALLGLGFWSLLAIVPGNPADTNFPDLIMFLLITEVILLGSWAIYNVYIRIARAGGHTVDIILLVIASFATGSYTFWAWTILDLNRFLMAKLFYRGEAPVEYAWSARSKQARKLWERAQKAAGA